MSVLARSVGNAFRNKIRTAAVVAVLAVAIGLALAMLVANQAVGAKVQELNASVGTTLTVNPAGGQGFEGGGEPLTAAQAQTVASVTNVTSVVGTKALRLQTATAETSTTQQGGGFGPGGQQASVTTNLTAAIDAGTLGNRNGSATNTGGTGTTQRVRTLPIAATGIGAEVDSAGKALDITSGTGLGDYTTAQAKALVGTTLRSLVEGACDESEHLLQARHYGMAPEIDGRLLINDGRAPAGTLVDVEITDAFTHDLVGRDVGPAGLAVIELAAN